MRQALSVFVGTIVTLVAGTIIAIAMQPFIAPHLVPHIRSEDQGLLFPSLVAGYFVIGVTLTALGNLVDVAQKTWTWILQTGAVVGLSVFLGDHLITSGWSQLAAIPMAVSGLLDSLSIVAGFASVAYVMRWRPQPG